MILVSPTRCGFTAVKKQIHWAILWEMAFIGCQSNALFSTKKINSSTMFIYIFHRGSAAIGKTIRLDFFAS